MTHLYAYVYIYEIVFAHQCFGTIRECDGILANQYIEGIPYCCDDISVRSHYSVSRYQRGMETDDLQFCTWHTDLHESTDIKYMFQDNLLFK